jgi:hypothetical protein
MSYEWPTFSQGLFGAANATVCNSWTRAAMVVADNEQALAWANAQMSAYEHPSRWLAKVTAAAIISPNRWAYTFEAVTYNGTTPAALLGTGQAGTGAINIRESYNTSAMVDSSALVSPATVGPVGSNFVSSAWSLTGLEAIVEMNVENKTDGSVLYWFSAPNSFRCGT